MVITLAQRYVYHKVDELKLMNLLHLKLNEPSQRLTGKSPFKLLGEAIATCSFTLFYLKKGMGQQRCINIMIHKNLFIPALAGHSSGHVLNSLN